MNKYTNMQKLQYEKEALLWSPANRNPVVGSFDDHNRWADYNDFLFKDIDVNKSKIVLDFGCGPGRNTVKYSNLFKSIDGVDISQKNLDNAKIWIEKNQLYPVNLFFCNGQNLDLIFNEKYDIVMSTICFQHIAVYDIRKSFLGEFLRVLKKGGSLTMQMGYGGSTRKHVCYKDNAYEETHTNGGCDVSVMDYEDLKNDLYDSGFVDFKHYIRPTGPGDFHKNWIFFSCKKPL